MVRMALVGCGGMGNWHAQQIQKIDEIKVVALADCAPEHMKPYKEKYFADAQQFDDYDTMLRKIGKDLDAVLLVTPHACHYPQAKAALEAGLHVMCEKPMVTSAEHAYDLWRTVKRTGKLLAITYQSPYTQEFGWLAKARDAGELGKVQLIFGWLSQNWMKGTKGKWRQDPAVSGGGQMYDSGAHLLNAIMWLMNDPVVEVACFYDKVEAPVDINGVAIARFQNGAMASICIGGNCPQFKTEIQIQTDKMLIITDQYGAKLEMMGSGGKKFYPSITDDPHPAAGTPHLNFVRALKGEEQLRAPVRYGVLLSALMDAMYESARRQAPLNVKAVPQEI